MGKQEKRLIAGGAVSAVLLAAAILGAASTLHPVSLPEDMPGEGIGRISTEEVFAAGITAASAEADWFRPEEAETVWTAPTDIGCPDWNVDSTLWGWDGHHMEAWEMDLYSRIFYLEFWQPDLTLCEAGCDAILRLWESEYYSTTMYGTLSAVTEIGDYAYSTYGYVWDWVYDPDGLAWCRAYCEERFRTGPVWIAPFFRKWCYHDWAMPCYQIGNIYFSTGWGWTD